MKYEDLNTLRPDLAFIAHWVRSGAHVLDVGCGDGAMLRYLERGKRCTGYGVEIADDKVLESTKRGINVIQHDMEAGPRPVRRRHLRHGAVPVLAADDAARRGAPARHRPGRQGSHRVLPELRLLAAPDGAAEGPHAGVALAALPVVRHAQRALRHDPTTSRTWPRNAGWKCWSTWRWPRARWCPSCRTCAAAWRCSGCARRISSSPERMLVYHAP
jgi:SAM-dependent methyltransferase